MKKSKCCKAKVRKFYQYRGSIEFDICSKCGKPQDYGLLKPKK